MKNKINKHDFDLSSFKSITEEQKKVLRFISMIKSNIENKKETCISNCFVGFSYGNMGYYVRMKFPIDLLEMSIEEWKEVCLKFNKNAYFSSICLNKITKITTLNISSDIWELL